MPIQKHYSMNITLMRITLTIFLLMLLVPNIAFSETKTFIKEYTYQASEVDSKQTCRILAMEQVKRLLLEELGTYLESYREVVNYQLKKSEITSLTAGIVKTEIVDEKWNGQTYWIKTKIAADPDDVVKSIDNLRKDRDKSRKLLELNQRATAILEENNKLREDLKLSKGEERQKQKQKYDIAINELSTIDSLQKNVINELSTIDSLHSGDMYYAVKEYNSAINHYSKAIKLNPQYARSFNSRGATYAMLSKYSEAIIDYNKAIELNPEFGDAYFNRGVTYFKIHKYSEANSDFSKAIELDPDLADAYCNRGDTYAKLSKYSEAISDYNKAIEINPQLAIAYYNRACIYSLYKNITKSIQDLSKAIQINPDLQDDAKDDRDFDNIRNTPDFKKLTHRFRQKVKWPPEGVRIK